MSTANDVPRQPDNPVTSEAEKGVAATTLLKAENERLQERIRQLEVERMHDRQTIATLQADRDAYRRAVYAWALEQITDEDLERYAQNEEGFPLDNFIGDLEQGAKVNREA